MQRIAWLGALGLIACGCSGGDEDPAGDGDVLASGGQLASGGSVASEGVGGAGLPSGGSTYDEGAGGSGTGGAAGSVGTGGAETPSGGESGTGGETSSGGDTSTGGAAAGVGGGESLDDCPYSGRVTYELNGPEGWPPEVLTRISEAMDDAAYYYNCYADLEKHITVSYDEGVPTAQANVDGWLSFGSDLAYMQTATAMHEISHTLGVGYYPWAELIEDGRWAGPAVDALMNALPGEERDPDMYSQRTYITCDAQHFWPYGLNQAAEYQSEWSVINHVRIVAAMNDDKSAFLNQ